MTMIYPERSNSDEIEEQIITDFYSNEDNSSLGSLNSKRRLRPPLGKKLADIPLSSGKITDKHYASDMMRRTVFSNNDKTTKEQQFKQDLSLSNGNDDDESLRSVSSIEIRTSNKQMKGLQTQSMMMIMQQVMEVHNTVTEVIKDLYHRKDLSSRVEVANQSYISLFERMLAEVLLLQRSKFNVHIKTIEEETTKSRMLSKKLEKSESTLEYMIVKSTKLTETNKELNATNFKKDGEIRELTIQVDALEIIKGDFMQSIVDTKKSKDLYILNRMELEKKIQSDDKINRLKELSDIRQQWLRDQSLEKDHETNKQQKAIEMAINDNETKNNNKKLKDILNKSVDFKRPKKENSCQTEIDDDGFWDVRKGWTLPVTGTAVARNRWRDAFKFSTCPSCKGIGGYVAQAVALHNELIEVQNGTGDLKKRERKVMVLKASDRVDNTLTSHESKEKHKRMEMNQNAALKTEKHKAIWKIPTLFMSFMSNLPATLFGITPYGRAWSIRKTFELLNSKFLADSIDAKVGSPIQDTIEFIIDSYLMTSSSRSVAEIDVYKLVMGLKNHYFKHPMVHTFTRILALVDGTLEDHSQDTDIMNSKNEKIEIKDDSKLTKNEKLEISMKEKKIDNPFLNLKKMILSDCAISSSICTVYLYARNCLLKEYKGIYETHIAHLLETSKIQKDAKDVLYLDIDIDLTNPKNSFTPVKKKSNKYRMKTEVDPNDTSKSIVIPIHIVIDNNLYFYIPMDRAVTVMKVHIYICIYIYVNIHE
jgi:hypothetical protein